jgi:hypothetical protein
MVSVSVHLLPPFDTALICIESDSLPFPLDMGWPDAADTAQYGFWCSMASGEDPPRADPILQRNL